MLPYTPMTAGAHAALPAVYFRAARVELGTRTRRGSAALLQPNRTGKRMTTIITRDRLPASCRFCHRACHCAHRAPTGAAVA
ncbi:hypothetical protein [Burkholderia vietnamiensis]|uniref:hypothetical protein n=1 Tax=Burkholderia vietnamiensis TaxID=60552 RepID=UPI001BAD357B|nr:hypothetical protein [Burkholderia vietnamiensis]